MIVLTARSLRRNSRRLDRLNVGIATVVAAMRKGATLHLTYRPTTWALSTGISVSDEIARLVVTRSDVVGVGDALFPDTYCAQTWRYLERS